MKIFKIQFACVQEQKKNSSQSICMSCALNIEPNKIH